MKAKNAGGLITALEKNSPIFSKEFIKNNPLIMHQIKYLKHL